MPKKMNALDAAITKGKKLPSKNKRIPGDTDISMPGFKKKPVITINKSKPYNDNAKAVIPPKVLEKIIKDSKAKAKSEVKKNKSPKTNWVTKIGSK